MLRWRTFLRRLTVSSVIVFSIQSYLVFVGDRHSKYNRLTIKDCPTPLLVRLGPQEQRIITRGSRAGLLRHQRKPLCISCRKAIYLELDGASSCDPISYAISILAHILKTLTPHGFLKCVMNALRQ